MLEKKTQPSENFTSADHGALKAVSFCSQALKHNKVQPLTDIFKHVRYHYPCIFCILEKNKGLKMTLFTVIWLIADPPLWTFSNTLQQQRITAHYRDNTRGHLGEILSPLKAFSNNI